MSAQAFLPSGRPEPHPNAARIGTLYAAIRDGDLTAIAACYDEQAYFQDIAFRRRGRRKIMEMWRYVCHGKPEVSFDGDGIVADDRTGSGHWRVKYMFGKTDSRSGRWVDNSVSSTFVFRDGLIAEHRDWCDAMAWARQALPFPLSLAAGSISPLRRGMAALKLHKFNREAKP